MRLLLVASLSLAMLWPVPLWAAHYFVHLSGSDANSCATAETGGGTPANAKLTPQAGAGCLTSGGDILTISAQTYTGSGARIFEPTITVANGSSGNPTIIEGTGSPGCALAHTCGTILRPTGVASNLESASWITVRLLEIDGVNNSNDDNGFRLGGTGEGVGSNIIFEDVEIHHASDAGIHVKPGYSAITMTRVNLHDNGQHGNDEGHGCYCSADNTTIEDSILHDNGQVGVSTQSYGVQFFSDEASTLHQANNAIFRRSASYDNNGGGIAIDGTDALVVNSLIYGNVGDGIDAGYSGAQRTLIYNNLVYDNSSTGIHIGIFGDADTSELINNHVIGNGTNITIDAGSTGVTQTTNRTTGSVTDCTNTPPNFTPKVGSSCADAGTTVAAVTDDYLGTSRPQNGTYDIGPYEVVVAVGHPFSGRMQGIHGMRLLRHGRSGW